MSAVPGKMQKREAVCRHRGVERVGKLHVIQDVKKLVEHGLKHRVRHDVQDVGALKVFVQRYFIEGCVLGRFASCEIGFVDDH